MSMPSFWDLVQRAKDETGASESWILKRSGMNHGAFTAWRSRGIPVLPPRGQLLLLAHALRVDYEHLIEVILHETKYLPADVALKSEDESRRWLNRGEPAKRPTNLPGASPVIREVSDFEMDDAAYDPEGDKDKKRPRG